MRVAYKYSTMQKMRYEDLDGLDVFYIDNIVRLKVVLSLSFILIQIPTI